MVGTVKTTCIFSVAVAIIASVANADTVQELVKQFQKFGPEYKEYLIMENDPAETKNKAFEAAQKTVEDNAKDGCWEHFYFGTIEIETFNEDGLFFTQFNQIYISIDPNSNNLRGNISSTLYEDPKIEYTDNVKLKKIHEFLKVKYAAIAATIPMKVAYHFEFVDTKDVTKTKNPDARKKCMLVLLARAR